MVIKVITWVVVEVSFRLSCDLSCINNGHLGLCVNSDLNKITASIRPLPLASCIMNQTNVRFEKRSQ